MYRGSGTVFICLWNIPCLKAGTIPHDIPSNSSGEGLRRCQNRYFSLCFLLAARRPLHTHWHTQTPGDQAGPVILRKQRPIRAKRAKGLALQGGWSLFCLFFRWCCRKRAHKAHLRLGLTFWMQKTPKQPPLCFVLSLTLVHNLKQSYVILFLGHLAPENEISFYFQLGLR